MTFTMEDAVAEMIRILSDDKLKQDWNNEDPLEEFFGKLGTLSPLNKAAFVKCMGQANADIAEDLALVKIANKLDIFLGTEYHKHEIEADLNSDKLIENSFVWTINSGFKCDGGRGLYEEIENCIKVHKRKTGPNKRLCYITKIYHVTEKDFKWPGYADALVQLTSFQGGSQSDDLEEDQYPQTKEDWKTFYSLCIAVEFEGKWFLINPEGYSYARYIYLPLHPLPMLYEEFLRSHPEMTIQEHKEWENYFIEQKLKH